MTSMPTIKSVAPRYDDSGDGVLSEDEMKKVLLELGFKQNKLSELFQKADANKDENTAEKIEPEQNPEPNITKG